MFTIKRTLGVQFQEYMKWLTIFAFVKAIWCLDTHSIFPSIISLTTAYCFPEKA
ncbi:hypothetical protein LguiA_003507 [Lonicera macranthoides]